MQAILAGGVSRELVCDSLISEEVSKLALSLVCIILSHFRTIKGCYLGFGG